ncbi:DNA-binding WRKY [Corchorus capsularis]|uniref:DNA-binding WRKY n=1 Tax=Corchorus capsularis TaxID=210143 RepID=A0A1R3IAH9_COCAP|nr:DNA-binding WRKY [Corchorus capsularis]
MENPPFLFDPWSTFDDFETKPKVVLDELQELYKPFYPDQLNPFSTQTIITNSLTVPQDHSDESADNKKRSQQSVSVSADQSAASHSGTNKDSTPTVPNKPKRSSRKNQQNRVVHHVKAEGVSSDIWAWRKYGQKPIKGSPYPRSYYRCSSSKGCLARKQVERSCSDPGTFIITYTAEHSHAHPTRRNSLAGSTRNKSSSTPKSTTGSVKNNEPCCEAADQTVVSPTTTIEEHEDFQRIKLIEEQMFEDIGEGDRILTPDIMLSDELVQSLENFEGLFLDQFSDLSNNELWSMNESMQP